MDKLTFIVFDSAPDVARDVEGGSLLTMPELVIMIGVVVIFFVVAVIKIRKTKKKEEEENINNKDSEE